MKYILIALIVTILVYVGEMDYAEEKAREEASVSTSGR